MHNWSFLDVIALPDMSINNIASKYLLVEGLKIIQRAALINRKNALMKLILYTNT